MPTERATVRRRAGRGHYHRETIDAILDEAIVCHLAVTDNEDDGPVVLPTGFVRIGDEVVVHGSASNHLLRLAAHGLPEASLVL